MLLLGAAWLAACLDLMCLHARVDEVCMGAGLLVQAQICL